MIHNVSDERVSEIHLNTDISIQDKFQCEPPFALILDDYYMKKEIKKLNLNDILREPSLST